jgi:NitT/TauT family transport system permease protein
LIRRLWSSRLPSLTASLLLLVGLWEIAALAADSRLLPGPAAVAVRLAQEVTAGPLLRHLAITLARVGASFVLSMAIGTAIGIAMGRLPRLDRFLDGWLVLFLNIPALVTIILAYVWFGLTETAAIAAVAINKIPNVVVTVREGARALDRDYLEMAQIYRFGAGKTLLHVVLPQLYPYLLASARSGLSLIWKIVLVVELLGRSNGMGFQLQMLFQLFDVTGILAYTAAFVVVVQVIETVVLQPLEVRATRWRR